nr:carbohydrate porin [uncultured Lichenicoccus sp.]
MSGYNGAKSRFGWRSRRDLLLAAGAIIGVASAPALAQTPDTGQGTFASQKLSNVPGEDYGAPALPAPEALVPQFNQYLKQYGAAVLLSNVDEFDANVTGIKTGSANAGQYGLEWDQDWDILAGIHGFQTHAVAVGRYGLPESRIFGDNLNPSQEIYGAGGNVAIHLVFFYGEETMAHGRFNLAFGRFPSQNDFDASPLNCNFQQNSLCGNPKAVGDNVSNSSYPDANWAFRLRVRPIAPVYIQAGIYFTENNIYNAGDGMRSGFHLDSSHINGEYFPVEIGFEPAFGPDKLPGHYKIGFGFDNNNHASNYLDENGAPVAYTGLPNQQRKGGSQAWVSADQMVLRNGPGATDGIIVKGDYVHNDPRYSTRADEAIFTGLDRGFWKARPFDTVGLLFAYTAVSGSLGKLEALQQELGEPVIGTGGSYVNNNNPYLPNGVQTHAMNIELNYQIHVYRGITFAPDFQYFIRPNAEKSLPDAALFGFKSVIELF